MENFQIYRDIQARTGGDIYIGVVGPVRTGKSTFIRRFMELIALPGMDEKMQKEVRDQLQDTFLKNAPVVKVSSVTGEGLKELTDEIV